MKELSNDQLLYLLDFYISEMGEECSCPNMKLIVDVMKQLHLSQDSLSVFCYQLSESNDISYHHIGSITMDKASIIKESKSRGCYEDIMHIMDLIRFKERELYMHYLNKLNSRLVEIC